MTGVNDLAERVAHFSSLKLLVIGDVMLDRFIYGAVDRISPEAPIPIFQVQREAQMPGGAANVARNALALGANVALISVVGDDRAAQAIEAHFARQQGAHLSLVRSWARTTTVKTRYVAAGQQLLRADEEHKQPLQAADEDTLLERAQAAIQGCDAVAVSDYAKGVLTDRVLSTLFARARAAGKPIICDPKSSNFSRYAGCTVLTPNARELAAASGAPCATDTEVEHAGAKILAVTEIGGLLVTRSEQGLSFLMRGQTPVHIRTAAREVFDVSGAGDTALAVFALAVASGGGFEAAAILSNAAAGIAVGKAGTAVVQPEELLAAVSDVQGTRRPGKIRSAAMLADEVAGWRARGLKVGFTNGCFDILHAGHVALLRQARAQCDRLIVAVNADASVRRLKGPTRPVNAEAQRAEVLQALESVDRLAFFSEDTPLQLIELLRPDVLIKGADYAEDQVVGGGFVKAYGGRVALIPLIPDLSTTNLIRKAAKGQGA